MKSIRIDQNDEEIQPSLTEVLEKLVFRDITIIETSIGDKQKDT
jgi:hypothetical protein